MSSLLHSLRQGLPQIFWSAATCRRFGSPLLGRRSDRKPEPPMECGPAGRDRRFGSLSLIRRFDQIPESSLFCSRETHRRFRNLPALGARQAGLPKLRQAAALQMESVHHELLPVLRPRRRSTLVPAGGIGLHEVCESWNWASAGDRKPVRGATRTDRVRETDDRDQLEFVCKRGEIKRLASTIVPQREMSSSAQMTRRAQAARQHARARASRRSLMLEPNAGNGRVHKLKCG